LEMRSTPGITASKLWFDASSTVLPSELTSE
jgi:hypothetical protein